MRHGQFASGAFESCPLSWTVRLQHSRYAHYRTTGPAQLEIPSSGNGMTGLDSGAEGRI
jgi:hypothetical protein